MAKKEESAPQVFTIIGKGAKLKGEVNAAGDMLVEGELVGTISCLGRVIIGRGGRVEGEVTADNCEVIGVVNGNIATTNKVTLKETARLTGKIKTKYLSIEPGAKFSGECDMTSEEEKIAQE